MARPGLVVMAGLPGTGKSTVALSVARRLRAAYLRIDTIEQSLVNLGELGHPPQAAGYVIGYGLAADQLRVGISCVVDCVNPLTETRDTWRRVAEEHDSWTVECELVCSDESRHRSRVERRASDIPGLVLPTWQQVLARRYETWDRPHLVIDVATVSVDTASDLIYRCALRADAY